MSAPNSQTAKARVLKAFPRAVSYNRGYDRHRKCNWWQVWAGREAPDILLGMGKSPAAAWARAEERMTK